MLRVVRRSAQQEAEEIAAPMKADRRLYLTADRARVVEEDDRDAASLLVPVGGAILTEVATRYGLTQLNGRVVLPRG